MKTTAASTTQATVPHYRIEDPNSCLSIRLHSVPCKFSDAPQIVARLDRKPTRFISRDIAEQAFARYCAGAVLEIVRRDA
jgi:hypothetical protein